MDRPHLVYKWLMVSLRHRERNRALVSSLVVTIACALPVFLIGSLAVQMQADLGFGDASLGVAVGVYYGAGALLSSRAGRIVEHLGARRSLWIATLIVAGGQIAVAVFVQSVAGLIAAMAVAGVASAWSQPASNVFLLGRVPHHRLGLVFGIQKSALPAAALLGGLAVPSFQAIGWRWAFAAGAAFAVLSTLTLPPGDDRRPRPASRSDVARPDVAVAALAVLAVGVGLGSAAGNALTAFLVRGGVEAGLSENSAAVMLIVGSVLGIFVRLLFGARADRDPVRTLPFIASLFVAASVAFALLATEAAVVFVFTVPFAFATAYAWPGLFHLAVVRANPSAPGTATGIAMTGTLAGAVCGPLGFGLLAEHVSYTAAWLSGSAMLIVASAIVLFSARHVVDAHHPAPLPA